TTPATTAAPAHSTHDPETNACSHPQPSAPHTAPTAHPATHQTDPPPESTPNTPTDTHPQTQTPAPHTAAQSPAQAARTRGSAGRGFFPQGSGGALNRSCNRAYPSPERCKHVVHTGRRGVLARRRMTASASVRAP